MAMYASTAELASYMQQDLDASTATLALTIASDLFATRANTRFEATNATTYTRPGDGSCELFLPHTPVASVSAVRINGVAITDYTRIGDVLYRSAGFGWPYAFPPDKVEVDYTHGENAPTDSVKGVVLETAAAIYSSPDITVVAEQIDDYSVRTAANAGGFQLSQSAKDLADWYRGVLVA